MVHSFLFVPASLARGGVLELSERREAQERGKWRVVKSRIIVSLSSPVCLERSIDKPDSSAQYCKRSIYSNTNRSRVAPVNHSWRYWAVHVLRAYSSFFLVDILVLSSRRVTVRSQRSIVRTREVRWCVAGSLLCEGGTRERGSSRTPALPFQND